MGNDRSDRTRCSLRLGLVARKAAKFTLLGALGLAFAAWDDGATSLFLAALLPVHLGATLALANVLPSGLRPHVWSAARVALLLPVFLGT